MRMIPEISEKRQIEILNRKVDIMNKSFASTIRKLSDENIELRLKNDPSIKTFHTKIIVGQVLATIVVIVVVAMTVANS